MARSGPALPGDAKDRLRRVFQFLRERADLDSPVERAVSTDMWQLNFAELPHHPAVTGGLVAARWEDVDEGGDVVLEVRRPGETPCPAPPEHLREWIEPGWDRIDTEAQPIDTLNRATKAGTQTVRFAADPTRVTAFALWRDRREVWRKAERPVRATIAIYERLFALRARLQREAERYRLLLGDGWLLWEHTGGRVSHPVLLHELELEFDERLPAVRLRTVRPTPELHTALLRLLPEVDGRAIAAAREIVERNASSIVASEAVAELITGVANILFPNALMLEGRAHPAAARPALARDPVIFLGTRAGTIQTAADRFIDALPQMQDLPMPLVRVVLDLDEPADSAGMAIAETKRAGRASSFDPLFTLPANQEQEEILRRLERDGAVVVQGPPGTGKTHTIANLIGHVLAQGKTILVTSHTTKALRVLRDKVVHDLRDLCVAYLDSDLRGREQLEASINGIVARLSRPDRDSLEEIARGRQHREGLQRDLLAAESELERALRAETEPIIVGGRQFRPMDGATRVREREASDSWIPRPVKGGAPLPLTVVEILELYRLQETFPKADEDDLSFELPGLHGLSPPEAYRDLLQEIAKLERDDKPPDRALWRDTSASLQRIEGIVKRALDSIEWITPDRWLDRCLRDTSRGGAFADAWEELRLLMLETLDAHEIHHAQRLRHEVQLPDLDGDVAIRVSEEIIAHLSTGGGLGWFARIGKGHWTELLEGSRIDEQPPSTVEHFKVVLAAYRLRSSGNRLRRRWAKQMAEHAAPPLPENEDEWPELLEPMTTQIARARAWGGEWAAIERDLGSLGLRWDAVHLRLPEDIRESVALRATSAVRHVITPAIEAIRVGQRIEQLRSVERRLQEHLSPLRSSGIGRTLGDAVQRRDAGAYASAYGRLLHLMNQRATQDRRAALLDVLQRCAPAWADAIRMRKPPHHQGSPPGDVDDAWIYAQISAEIEQRQKTDLDALQRRVVEMRERLQRETAALVARMAWSKQVERTTPSARRNLTGWVDYQKQIGKGTGKRAPLLQRKALELLTQCKDSVPVWIMPLSKVIESYDLARTRFDVVIIDEASQCDVNGLFAFGLARDIVVVGDDQQVSPLAVGENLDRIQKLIDLHLEGIPNKDLFTGRLSIYDLGRQSQPAIRLREHFRCVPEIIAFSSSMAYDGEIQPLRESASARVRPAIVEHCVPGLKDDRNVNQLEAIEVVALLVACTEQPEYGRATMGVISLLGDHQWDQIERLLHSRLEAKEIERRRILCGAPPHFQGDERDVIFISMVWTGSGTPLPLNESPDFKKRLNVAASRARDQMWVVHSLNPDTELKPGDLRRRLIEHARNPRALLDAITHEGRVESDFERRVLKHLQARNFRVKPQWEVGAYRIDLVVEGSSGRVAVECDGDRWHEAPDKMREDRARQQQLERLGWRFIRIRGSEFERSPEKTMERVAARLQQLEIEPIGPENAPGEALGAIARALRERIVRRAHEIADELRANAEEIGEEPRRRGRRKAREPSPLQAGEVSSVVASSPPAAVPASDGQKSSRPPGRGPRPQLAGGVTGPGKYLDNQAAAAGLIVRDLAKETDAVDARGLFARDGQRNSASEETKKSGARTEAEGSGTSPRVPLVTAAAADLPALSEATSSKPDYRRSRDLVCRELQTLDARFHDPRCGDCRGAARLDLTQEGIVLVCMAASCGVIARVDLETLQRLADHLGVKCFSCKGRLESRANAWRHYLRCSGSCQNNTWEGVNKRLKAEKK
jgi:very-short-patch-repair endonuclease